MKRLTPEKIAYDLFHIHTHGQVTDPEEIVYREVELIDLFEKWGIPAPDWTSKKYLSLFKRRKTQEIMVIEPGKYTKADMVTAIVINGEMPQKDAEIWLRQYDAKKRKSHKP